MAPSRTAFVAGATGYTGRNVVEALLRAGVSTVAHVRPGSPRREHWVAWFGGRGAAVDTSPWERDALVATLERHAPDVVFALLGTTRKRAAREGMSPLEAYERIDHGLTVMLLQAARAAVPRARFVYLSVAGVRGGTGNAYVDARWRTEEAIRAAAVAYTIVRPVLITGPDRDESRPAERAAGVALDGLLGLVGALGGKRIEARHRTISGEALGAALVAAAFDPQTEGKVLTGEALRGSGLG